MLVSKASSLASSPVIAFPQQTWNIPGVSDEANHVPWDTQENSDEGMKPFQVYYPAGEFEMSWITSYHNSTAEFLSWSLGLFYSIYLNLLCVGMGHVHMHMCVCVCVFPTLCIPSKNTY